MTKMKLVNVMEEIVTGLVRYFLHSPEYQTFCHCEECQLKIAAEALNHLSAYYAASENEREEIFNELKNLKQMESINKEIIRAIHEAGKRKHFAK